MNPLISIIIPTYNRAHLIEETLDSIIAQTYTNWECVVVDDGSTDNTENLLNDYCIADNRIQFYKRPLNMSKGANACRNFGFEKSKGDYIKWLDSDDLLFPNALQETLINFNTVIDVVICKLQFFEKNSTTGLRTNTIYSENTIEDYLARKVAYFICGPTWKKSFLEQQNYLFDEAISNLDDWDFNLRMLYQNPEISYINDPLIYYRVHENSLSHEIEKLNFQEILSEIKAREKHLELIKLNKKANPIIVQRGIKERYFYFYRKAMVIKHEKRFYFFKKLIKSKMELLDILGGFKTIGGFVIYYISKKGYKYLK